MRLAITAFALSMIGTLICFAATGATLGLFIGGLVCAAIIAPPLVPIAGNLRVKCLTFAAIVFGVAFVWAIVATTSLSFTVIVNASMVLAAFTLCLAGLSQLLGTLPHGKVVASAMITLMAIGWLAWPFWFPAESISSTAMQRCVAMNPIFVIDGLTERFDIWTQRPVLYTMTSLGQDVPYALPKSIWLSVAIWEIVGCSAIAIVETIRSRRTTGVVASAVHV